jgi:hypothetical protein
VCPQISAGVPTDLDSPTLDLCVELRPVGEVSSRRVEEPKQAAWRTVLNLGPRLSSEMAALVSPIQVAPISG